MESVWAGAPTPEKARELVDRKTLTFTPAQPPRLIVYSPWLDNQLTTCDLDRRGPFRREKLSGQTASQFEAVALGKNAAAMFSIGNRYAARADR
jgi:hypothetical protein